MIMRWTSVAPELIDGLRSMAPESFDGWLEDSEGRDWGSFDVDKAWHAVHLTLTGDPWEQTGPFGAVVLGGDPFGEDLGTGQRDGWAPIRS